MAHLGKARLAIRRLRIPLMLALVLVAAQSAWAEGRPRDMPVGASASNPTLPDPLDPGRLLADLAPAQLETQYPMVRVRETTPAEADLLLADAEAALYLPSQGEVVLLATPAQMGQAERRAATGPEAAASSAWGRAEDLGPSTLPAFLEEMARAHPNALAGRSGPYLLKIPVRVHAPASPASPGMTTAAARGETGGIVVQEGFEANPWARWLRADSTGGQYTWDVAPCSPHGGALSAYATAGGSVGSTLTCGTPYAPSAFTFFADGQCEDLQGASEAWLDLYFSLNVGAGSSGAINFTFPQPSTPSWFIGYGFIGNMGTAWVHFTGNLRQWNGFDLTAGSCNRLKVDFGSDAYAPSGFGARVDDITIQTQTPPGMSCGIAADQTGGPAPFTVNLLAQVLNPGQGLALTWHFLPDQDTGSTPTISHTFTSPGHYVASLEVVGSNGRCEAAIPLTVGCLLDCTASPSATFGAAPLPVTFTASATPNYCGGTPTFAWTFGDGGTSTEQNPVHTYTAPGTYMWTLTVTDDGATCSRSGSITACDLTCTATAPQTAAPGSLVSLQANVASTLCNAAPNYDWDFGDGSAHAPGPSVSHVYPSGVYTWTMTAILGALSCTRTGTLSVCTLSCDASASATTGAAPLAVSFASSITTSQGCPTTAAYDWDFGDGTAHSSLQDPVHTYASPGTYGWTLSATANGLTRTKTGSLQVCPLTCAATVPATLPSGSVVPFQASASTGTCAVPVSYDWDFGDASAHSPEQNPQHTYPGEGSYAWTLTVTSGGASCVRTGTVTLCALTCSAAPSSTMGVGPFVVNFTGNSTLTPGCSGTPSYDWDFGDGSPHVAYQNPSRTYAVPGPHTWVMTVNSGGLTCSKTGTVTVCNMTCTATPSTTSGEAPLGVTFSATATQPPGCPGTPVFDWNFGDGSLHSSAQNPDHTYAFPGTYTWSLTVAANGLTCSKTGTVRVCQLTCSAAASKTAGFAPLAVSFTGGAAFSSGCTGPVTYDWDFGDGTAHASSQNPSRTYAVPGVFTWTLTASAPGLTCSQTGTVSVCSLLCQASSSVAMGVAPLSVTFTGIAAPSNPACTGTPLLDWDFGDGSPHGSGGSVSHSYTHPGTYEWTLRGTLPGASCTKTGTLTVYGCSLTCSASASPGAGDPTTPFQFSATASSPDCPGTPVLDWDFGDGSPHSADASASHSYANDTSAALSFTWTLTASLNGTTCARSGQVIVAPLVPQPLQGYVGVCTGGGFWPLNTDGASGGVANLHVFAAENADPGNVIQAQMDGSHFLFDQVPPSPYTLYAEMDYLDNVTVDNGDLGDRGCPAPVLGSGKGLLKHVISPGTSQPAGNFAEVCFPAPLVMLHGAQDCYTKWYSPSGDPTYWDNAARAGGPAGTPGAGFVSFTPNYKWWGPGSSWEDRGDEVLSQLQADLAGLVGTPVGTGSAGLPAPAAWPPYTVIAHDMGGLVTRVLTAGRHRDDPVMQAMGAIYLLGTPNSGTDLAFGGGADGPMSVQAIVRRFNALYPDFGGKTGQVVALAGKRDWWDQGNADGPVSLYSAFNITQVSCSAGQGGDVTCQPFPSTRFSSASAQDHIFPYGHDQLGGPDSTDAILKGLILPELLLGAADSGHRLGGESSTSESPVGATTWGSNARTTGDLGGSGGGALRLEATQSLPFTVGVTDGMALLGFVTSGSATFVVVDPSGQTQAVFPGITSAFTYTTLNPASGAWTLRVTPDPGGVSFTGSVAEDSPFDARGYLVPDHLSAGDTGLLRLGLTGDSTGLSVSAVTAQVFSGGAALGTVTLDPEPGAASGSYSGTWATPADLAPGTYPVLFTVLGTYGGAPASTVAFDTLHVLPSAHLFTGVFSDVPLDVDGDGAYDALQVTAQAGFSTPGRFVISADLYDASGNFVDHASGSTDLSAPGPAALTLTFDLRGIYCSQFAGPFSVESLNLVDGDTLQPLDVWPAPVSTSLYAGESFQCRQGAPAPRLSALRPDQGLPGQSPTILVGGRRFKAGATLTFDSGIIVNETSVVSDRLLGAFITIDPTAQPGPRSVTLTNPDGGSDTLQGGFTVALDQPPTVAMQSPADGTVLPDTGNLVVSAAASDDVKVTQVAFLLDGSIVSTDFQFPFVWRTTAGSIPHGVHTLAALATDTKGQTAEASVTVIKSPPTVTSVTGGGTPWKLKIGGTNFINGATVTIGEDAQPWAKVTFKNSTLLLLKGGAALKAKFPIGRAVTLTIRNPDGTSASASFMRTK